MNVKRLPTILATLLVLAICPLLFGQEPAAALMLGIDVTNGPDGMRVDRVEPGRPIAAKLQVRDVLISYVILGDDGENLIQGHDDVAQLKRELENGKSLKLTYWRPDGNEQPPTSYFQRTVQIAASDLLPQIKVQQKQAYSMPRVGNPPAPDARPPADDDGIVEVVVGYATDRRLENGVYSGNRDGNLQPVKYGICTVTLPPDHRLGELEGPKWWRFEFRPNPEKHVVLSAVNQIGKVALMEHLSEQFEGRDVRRMLVFVHGYNVTFADAARRTAQLHYDLNFPGLAAFFSWPSDGDARSYVSDGGDIVWSTPHIRGFLELLCNRPDVDEVYVLAHSMGNRGVTRALLDLPDQARKIREVILAAPDIDADVFDRDIAPVLSNALPRTTLYASATDLALWSSETLNEVFRAGEIRDGKPTIKTLEKMDIIDATNAQTSFLGHSYYGDGESIISDIFRLIHQRTGPEGRLNLVKKSGTKGEYWVFQ